MKARANSAVILWGKGGAGQELFLPPPNLRAAAESQARTEGFGSHSRGDKHPEGGGSGEGAPQQPEWGAGTAPWPTIQHGPPESAGC